MFKTLIIFIALNFWVIEGTPNPGRSFPHWRASMAPGGVKLVRVVCSEPVSVMSACRVAGPATRPMV